jgi:hypothetical protein
MLSRNDQLSLGGRAPRARRSCYVDEPACGFFVAGSSLKPCNGVYIRRNPSAATLKLYAASGRQPLLYYAHMERDSEWTLALVETRSTDPAEDEESDDEYDDRYAYARGHFRPPKPQPERWWCLSQETSNRIFDRFRHIGDTIVPGAGAPRWSHVHASAASAPASAPPSATSTAAASVSAAAVASAAAAARATRSWFGFGPPASAALARAEADDEDELPWQVAPPLAVLCAPPRGIVFTPSGIILAPERDAASI